MTYHQKTRVIAKLKRVQNYLKHQSGVAFSEPGQFEAVKLVNRAICELLADPNTFYRDVTIPRKVWRERKP